MTAILQIISLLLDVAFMVVACARHPELADQFQCTGTCGQPMVASVWDGLCRLLEPVYQPIRRILPNTGALDLSPLVAFLLIIILRDIVLPDLARALM